ncbi:hypothetical protein K435DRAFT_973888 [Dendrothele bispora CBS 962.96]|uniref:TPR-like protein n=1 Tax=Dendrothele bispora (strain CBS 962.96) TaxID=1314807 RepID=A0A4S8KPR8_DENBC|nr:hypothetical protein K435DRAFT_973888 [Dendrothele bispora CBS 962.96]
MCKHVDSLWTWLEHYTSCSSYWPSNFRTEHRATVSALYLRALILRYGPSTGSSPVSNVKSVSTVDGPPAWMHAARSLIQEYRAILSVSTRFPRAGERNWKVEDFVDMCVSIWDVAGAGADYTGWVLDVLEWSTRLTFNSSRVLRHMTRLLYVSGDTGLAKRTLRLYVQIVSKAFQTKEAATANGIGTGGASNESVDAEPEDKQKWMETLVFGVRMLCRIASSSSTTLVGSSSVSGAGTGPTKSNWKEMTEELREAEKMINIVKAELEADSFGEERKELAASILLAEGVWNWVMGLKGRSWSFFELNESTKSSNNAEQDPLSRPSRLEEAHALLKRSIEAHPTSAAHYHLALSYAYKRAHSQPKPSHHGVHGNGNAIGATTTEDFLDSAIQHAALATELCPQEIRYWHLLGLLSAKTEKWEAAVGALDIGRGIGEGGDQDGDVTEADDEEETQRADVSTVEGLPAGDGGSHPLLKDQPSNKTKELKTQTDTSSSTPPQPLYVLSPAVNSSQIPPASELLQPASATSEPSRRYESKHEAFEYALQLRMTQVTVSEYVEGVEGAVEKLREVFEWVAEKRGLGGGNGDNQPRQSFDATRSNSGIMKLKSPSELRLGSQSGHGHDDSQDGGKPASDSGHTNGDSNTLDVPERPSLSTSQHNSAMSDGLHPPIPIPIMISPATPEQTTPRAGMNGEDEKDPLQSPTLLESRDPSKPKKMQERLKSQVGQVKSQVHKGSVRISTISKKIGHGVVKNGSLRRVSSASDLHSVLRPTSYQASSIHSRRRNSFMRPSMSSLTESPPPPPPPLLPPSSLQFSSKWNNRTIRENRLLSDLWLMSAATFRRLGKIEQAKGAIQEAEVKDEGNPAVWVQLGLYFIALGRIQDAIDSFHKALFISTDDIASTVHLSRIYLFPAEFSPSSPSSQQYSSKFNFSGSKEHPDLENVDLAAGMLEHITKGVAWDVPEAWYFLGKAYGFQGRKEKERECLSWALRLSERRGVRDMVAALGVCL